MRVQPEVVFISPTKHMSVSDKTKSNGNNEQVAKKVRWAEKFTAADKLDRLKKQWPIVGQGVQAAQAMQVVPE